MLKHLIIICKPKIQAPAPPAVQTYNPQAMRMTQEQFEKFLAELSYKTGDLITWGDTSGPINSLYQAHMILDIERNYNRLTWTYNQEPKFAQLAQVCSANQDRWVRWDYLKDYRKLTVGEIKSVIEPNNDKVSDCAKLCKRPENTAEGSKTS